MPLAGFGWHGPTTYVGVGRQYRIDMKGGGKDDGYLGYIENVPIMIFNALTFQNVGAHLTDAYQASFTVASEVIIEAAHIKKVAIAKLTGST